MTLFSITDIIYQKRRPTITVKVGNTPLGSSFPVRVQTMTNTETSDIEKTVNQIVRVTEEGSEYVRLTVRGIKDAENLKEIVKVLRKKEIDIPLIADIHFNPKLAIIAAGIVDKIRVNPGNFIDRKNKQDDHISEKEKQKVTTIEQEIHKLIQICRANSTAIRVGTNHGSLSDRILDMYGDTPEGMVESAMEFIRICMNENFHDLVVSLKASNTKIMVHANRLLVRTMLNEDMHYPIHLGVTEAGEGEDGRIKSAIGIGTLLSQGIGDTIRVSLTEDPEIEIPVAKKITKYISELQKEITGINMEWISSGISTFDLNRPAKSVLNLSSNNVPVVIISIQGRLNNNILSEIGWYYTGEKWLFNDQAPDYILTEKWPVELPVPDGKGIILCSSNEFQKAGTKLLMQNQEEYFQGNKSDKSVRFLLIKVDEVNDDLIEKLNSDKNIVLILEATTHKEKLQQRMLILKLLHQGITAPLIIKNNYNESCIEDLQIKASIDLGSFFIDRIIDGIWIENTGNTTSSEIIKTAFGILQATRQRITKTEYISCPSCGRTMFDIQETVKNIRQRTSHLKGLKIGIMGCIVNGPGEMADADYGYVGSGVGLITLYKGKEIIKKHIKEKKAVDELIELIKQYGDWTEP